MELKYFALYAKAEPIRMCLWKAGVEYKDTRVEFADWPAVKPTIGEFGQMPILVLADGTTMSQGAPILDYLGSVHGLKPTDAMENYKGSKAREHMNGDFWSKHVGPIMYYDGDDKQAKIDAMVADQFPAFLKTFSDNCLGDTKFLCGDTLTTYDMDVAGKFTNCIFNPNCRLGTGMAVKYEECASEKLKNYINAFKEEMKEYLAIRETQNNVYYA